MLPFLRSPIYRDTHVGRGRAAEADPDVVRAVAHIVDGSVVLLERAAPLVWVMHGDEDARPTYEVQREPVPGRLRAADRQVGAQAAVTAKAHSATRAGHHA